MKNKLKNGAAKSNLSSLHEELRTDFPLCEKDEQAIVIERLRKMQLTAMLRWRASHQDTK